MKPIDKQRQLEAEFELLHEQRDALTKQIVVKRKEVDQFLKHNGNLVLKESRRVEWEAKQEEFAERRKDPEWQKWRKEFLGRCK